jgi:hypothetical protein
MEASRKKALNYPASTPNAARINLTHTKPDRNHARTNPESTFIQNTTAHNYPISLTAALATSGASNVWLSWAGAKLILERILPEVAKPRSRNDPPYIRGGLLGFESWGC